MFLHAIMLAGIGAAVMPIVLHLLSKARYRTIDWGAMMFLVGSTSRLKNRSRIAQWLLLALRVAAIALLAIALARPVLRRIAGPAGHGLAAAIVIDGSPSMLHPEQNSTRFELARKAALGVLSDLRPGDEVALIELGAPPETDTPPTTDLQRIASRLASLEPAPGSADLADGVRRAKSLLADRGGVPREIYCFADRQKSTWQSLAHVPRDAAARVVVTAVGSTENRNVAVQAIDLLDPPAVAGIPVRVRVRVHNWADSPRGDLPLTISVGGGVADRVTLNLGAGATEDITRSIAIPRAGPGVITAAIAPAGMPGDDSAMVALDVVDPLPVLVISSDPAALLQKLPSPALTLGCDFLSLALNPFRADGQKNQSAFAPAFVADAPWPKSDLHEQRVVILADTVKLDAASVAALEQFVFAGGGLLLAPGAHVSPDEWNRLLWNEGQGLSPAPIASIESGTTTSIVGVETSSPIFSFFTGASSTLPPVDVVRWAKFSARSGVLASLKSGDPFLLEKTFGRGRVIAMAGPVDASWSNLPITRLYLPLMQSIVRRLAASTDVERNLAINSPIEATIRAPKSPAVEVVRPDGRVDRATLSVAGGVGTLVYQGTNIPGKYAVPDGKQGELPYIVRSPGSESDLNLQDDTALKQIVSTSAVELIGAGSPLAVGNSRKGSEWSIPLILMTIVALAIETMVTTRLSAPAGEP